MQQPVTPDSHDHEGVLNRLVDLYIATAVNRKVQGEASTSASLSSTYLSDSINICILHCLLPKIFLPFVSGFSETKVEEPTRYTQDLQESV